MPQIGKELRRIDHWFDPLPVNLPDWNLSPDNFHYLAGRYGQALPDLVGMSTREELSCIDDLSVHWAELPFNARFGMVEHLDDLLLRRTRLGMLLPEGGTNVMDRVKALTQGELRWTEEEWQSEISRYQQIYREAYSPIPESSIKQEK